jgi:Reverse transcriptase (RNA-dependent DNA polymerase)
VLIQGEKISKLAPKSTKMKFVGFADSQKAIRFYDPTKRTIHVSRNFVFNEDEEIQEAVEVSSLPGLQLEGETGSDGDLQTPAPEVLDSRPMARKVEAASPHTPAGDECRITTDPITYPPRPSRAVDRDYRQLNNPLARPTTCMLREPLDVRRPTESSAAKQKERASAETHIAYAYSSAMQGKVGLAEKDPWDLREAKEAVDWDKWEVAIKEELDQLEETKTWELMDLPEGREPIGNKWVFVQKRDESGDIVKHKARLVAQGFSQKPGVDYSETGTFAPVM